MKKNISINISGIIFHIEEDAYEKLKDYLDSINRYFSNFDGSQEIIADIESRIAEIFLSKLTEEKQIITHEDVEALILTMGSIKDFQAVEESEIADDDYEKESYEKSGPQWSETGSKKMYRDERRKLLGGVCAGMAHYFSIDPLWIRLIAIILVFGSYGGLIIAYIILWAVLPSNHELPEDKKLKKMYRNPDGKVIAGVSSGVATYFSVDVVVIRLLFVIFTFLGGAGLLAYLILWIILPEAKTITDKVQMQGDPVTLSNIESSIKRELNVKEGEENIFVKILLFPFRLIATVLNGIGKAFGPILIFLVDFIRVAAGVVFILIGASIILSIVVVLGMLLGLLNAEFWGDQQIRMFGEVGFPVDLISNSFPVLTSVAAFLAIFIPSLFLILLGASVIAKKIIFNATVGWSLFAVFIISGIVISVNVPQIIYKFKEEGEHKVVQTYDLGEKTAVLTLRETGLEHYNVTRLKLRGHDGANYELEQLFEARGNSRKNAIENAQMVNYNVTLDDSVFIFDSNISFRDNAIFRAQQLEMTLYIPYNKPFKMEEDLRHIIRNTIYQNGYRVSDMEDNIWIFTENGKLKCTTCPESRGDVYDSNDRVNYRSSESVSSQKFDREYTFNSFESLEIESAFTVNVINSSTYKVGVNGREKYIDDLNIYVEGETLYIDSHAKAKLRNLMRGDIEITIFTPALADIEVTGACKLYMDDFRQRSMTVSLTGASFAKLSNLYIDNLEVEMTGASEMSLSGKGNNLDVDITGASYFNADDYETSNANVEAHGASSAKVYVTQDLTVEQTFASKVDYRGGASMRKK